MPQMEEELAKPQPERWDFWRDGARSPAENMAADEVLMQTSAQRGRPVLRCYSWDRPAVSIGYVQRHDAAPAGFAMVRRPTGGGVVYHDHDFTYSIAFPPGHWLNGLDRIRSYSWINRSLRDALRALGLDAQLAAVEIPHSVERATMVCFINPTRYDLLLDGRKIAGSAQRRTADGILHQGSLHFGGPLPFTRETIAGALAEALGRVMNVTLEDFTPDAALMDKITCAANEKYGTDNWNKLR